MNTIHFYSALMSYFSRKEVKKSKRDKKKKKRNKGEIRTQVKYVSKNNF